MLIKNIFMYAIDTESAPCDNVYKIRNNFIMRDEIVMTGSGINESPFQRAGGWCEPALLRTRIPLERMPRTTSKGIRYAPLMAGVCWNPAKRIPHGGVKLGGTARSGCVPRGTRPFIYFKEVWL